MAHYLDPVVAIFVADASAYLGPVRDMRTAALAAAAANERLVESCVQLDGVLDDVAISAGAAANRLNDFRDAAATTAGADTALAHSLDAVRESVDANTMAVAVLSGRMNDLRDAMAGAALAAGLLAKANTGAAMTGLAAGAVNAGNGFRLLGTGMRLTGTTLHWIIAGTMELLAVLIPATVAAGAWAAVWLQGAGDVYERMTAVYTATEALGGMYKETAGQAIGLGHALQTAQNAADPKVFQALGSAILLVKESAGGLVTVGTEVGNIFDQFMARLVYDFSAAGGGAKQLNGLLSAMVPDLVHVGQVFGNLGGFLASFASQMPGLAELLLGLLAGFLNLAKGIVDFTNSTRIFGVSILTVLMAMEEFARWGGLVVSVMGKMGIATTALAGNFSSVSGFIARFGSVALNLVRAPMMLLSQGIAGVGHAISLLPGRFGAAGDAIEGFGTEIGLAGAALTPGMAVGILAAAAALGFLIYKLVTAKSAAQQFVASIQDTVSAASQLDVMNTIAAGMGRLNVAIRAIAPTVGEYGLALKRGQYASDGFARSIAGQQAAYESAQSALNTERAGLQQLTRQFVNTNQGAEYLAKTYGTSLPGALALAQQAGVKLQDGILGQGRAATLARLEVASLVQGYEAMGQPANAIGNDMSAVAVQSGLAATKISQLNQAWDQFMSNVTGGTGGLADFETSLSNIGSVAGTVKNNLGEATVQMSLSASQFANALKSSTGTGAAAWTNFDQVVGSTMPQMADWLRTAGAEGALSSGQFTTAIRDMVAQMLPMTAHNKAAVASLSAIAQMAGGPATSSYKTLAAWTGHVKDATGSLASIVDGATVKMGNLNDVAQALGNTLSSDLNNDLANAKNSVSGVTQAMIQYDQSIRKGDGDTAAGHAARAAAISDVQYLTGDSYKAAAAIVDMAGKWDDWHPANKSATFTFTTQEIFKTSGNPGNIPYLPGAGGGGLTGPSLRLGASSNVTIVHQNIAGSVLSDQALARAAQGATLRKTVRNASTQTFLPGRLH